MTQTKGASLIVTSAFFYATYGIWSRLMSANFGEFSQAWTRALILLIFIILLNLKFKFIKPLSRADLPWLTIIALAGGLNQAPYFYGFKYLPIGTATLLFYGSLVTGGYLLGKIAFKENINLIKLISLLSAFIGMFAIYQFQLQPSQYLPALLTIIAGFMGSVTVILPKKLVGGYHEFQIMIGYFSVGIIANSILGLIFHDPIPAINLSSPWLAQFGYATSMILANWAAIIGYRHFDASIGSLLGLAEIIFGLLFGLIFFHEVLTVTTLIGTFFILFSAILPQLFRAKNPHS